MGAAVPSLQEDASSSGYHMKYVSHVFSGGADCLLTGSPRTAEVRGTWRHVALWPMPQAPLVCRPPSGSQTGKQLGRLCSNCCCQGLARHPPGSCSVIHVAEYASAPHARLAGGRLHPVPLTGAGVALTDNGVSYLCVASLTVRQIRQSPASPRVPALTGCPPLLSATGSFG